MPPHIQYMLSCCQQIYQPRYMHPQAAPGQVPQMSSAYPGTQMFMPMPQTMPVGTMGPNVPVAYYPMGPVYPPGSTVLVEGGFDAGARFGPGANASIPVSRLKHLAVVIFMFLYIWREIFVALGRCGLRLRFSEFLLRLSLKVAVSDAGWHCVVYV